ncbi:MAG: Gfo/Idh/MocA family oxidoreductase [Actinobacteria bacterium]|nr:Gfo/Idh/MocA family oxidoreductase [Actinomycetota bacterium]
MKKIKVGFIGLGVMGRIHFETLKLNKNVEIKSLFDVNYDLIEELSKTCNAKPYKSLEDLLNSGIDAVWVCTPEDTHYGTVKNALDADKHVFVEKTLDRYYQKAKELTELSKAKNNLLTMVGYPIRFDPNYRKMKEICDKYFEKKIFCWSLRQQLTTPSTLCYDRYRNDYYYPPRWYFEKKGGGALFSHASHDYDFLQWCFGDIVEVQANAGIFLSNGEAPDECSVNLKFENGAIGVVSTIWTSPIKFNYVGLVSEQGSIVLPEEKLILKINKEPETEIRFKEYSMWENEDNYFIDCILSSIIPEPSFDDGLKAVLVATAALKSFEENKAIKISELK